MKTDDAWIDGDKLTEEEKAMLDARLAQYEKNPEAGELMGGSGSAPSNAAPGMSLRFFPALHDSKRESDGFADTPQ
jgi:hypothetical protein